MVVFNLNQLALIIEPYIHTNSSSSSTTTTTSATSSTTTSYSSFDSYISLAASPFAYQLIVEWVLFGSRSSLSSKKKPPAKPCATAHLVRASDSAWPLNFWLPQLLSVGLSGGHLVRSTPLSECCSPDDSTRTNGIT